jgi:hypothetical protein
MPSMDDIRRFQGALVHESGSESDFASATARSAGPGASRAIAQPAAQFLSPATPDGAAATRGRDHAPAGCRRYSGSGPGLIDLARKLDRAAQPRKYRRRESGRPGRRRAHGRGSACGGRIQALPHRLEAVAMVNGVRFVNDSKATNVDAVLRALECFERPVVLIMGGRNKGYDFKHCRIMSTRTPKS